MSVTLKYLEVRYASYEHGISEFDWAFAPIEDRSKTIRQLIDETINEVQTGENKNAEFDGAFRFGYEAGGLDYHIDYDGMVYLCRIDPEDRILAEDRYQGDEMNRTLDDMYRRHSHIIEQYTDQPIPKKKEM